MAIRGVLFHDDDHWVALAAKTRYALPNPRQPCEVEAMRLWLSRLDKDERWHRFAFGCTLEQFPELNPHWGLRGWVGLLLEATVGAN